MNSQDKYINEIKNEIFSTVDNSFEPLLENYIGYQVILELNIGDELTKCEGILKRYTSEFIELIDVDYNKNIYQGNVEMTEKKFDKNTGENKFKKVDLIIPRRYGVVRGLTKQDYKIMVRSGK